MYVPFTKSNSSLIKDSDQYFNVLNIVVEETRIFSTKMRAPFYICLEVYNPIEGFSDILKDNYFNKIQRPITLKVQKAILSKICILRV